ncbi:HAD family hydrolase [Terriglobus aquaticus]|uniref:phosphoglycolate phosphatase n=1 Tax=Terriglobus aquaticus TaxID=940139 RepID=A0ABW9KMN6_9BACT|nr:HAD family hydrolase [Terriglobus aquaticus]
MGLSRAWDAYDAYLFDIDGTLLHCKDAVHYFGFCHALTNAAGRPVDILGLPVQGKIDPGILREAFARAGVPESEWRPRLPEILDEMAAHVEAHANDFQIDVLPGVREVLQHLRERGAKLGTGTGNLERIGWAKLKACGLREFFDFGGFSNGYEHRGEMIAGAAETARRLTRKDAAILVVGDTPGDIAAARFAGLEVLAVATGIFSAEQLAEADQVVSTLESLLT